MDKKEIYIRYKNGKYNNKYDYIPGLLVFDSQDKDVYVGGKKYGPLSRYIINNTIDSNSNNNEFVPADVVNNYINNSFNELYNQIKQDNTISDDSPTKIPYAYTIVDNDTDNVYFNTLLDNVIYYFNKPLNTIVIDSINNNNETIIYFTTNKKSFEFYIIEDYQSINKVSFEKNTQYCATIKNNTIGIQKITPISKEIKFLHTGSQIPAGFIDFPNVINFDNNEINPVINVQPNTIYKLGTCESITLNNIPSNTIETTIIWNSDKNTTVYLNPDNNTKLHISQNSEKFFTNNSYVMTIKDGNILISSINKL